MQFDPIPGLTNAHLGAFWQALRSESNAERWVKVNDAPTIEPAFEVFGSEQAWDRLGMGLRITRDPASRLQIKNDAGDAMIQVQNGRLHYNWIGRDEQEYRRYKFVRPRFDAALAALRRFLADQGLPEMADNQWEVTYVNHMPKGTVWNEPADWGKLFVGLTGVWSEPSKARFESCAGAWHFEIPPQRGRLHIDLRHSQPPEGPEFLRLTLTARGPTRGDSSLNLSDGLDLGRAVIVSTFVELHSEHALEQWGIRR